MMAAAEKKEGDVFVNIVKILGSYTELAEMHEALRILHEKKVISGDDYKTSKNFLKQNHCREDQVGAVFGLIVNSISKSPNWQQLFLNACEDKGFPGDRALKTLLRSAVETTDDSVRFLIDSWDKLDGLKERISLFAKQIWSRKFWKKYVKPRRTRKYSWKVYLLYKCTTTKKPEKVKVLADKVRTLINELSSAPAVEKDYCVIDDPEADLKDTILELRLNRADTAKGGRPHVYVSTMNHHLRYDAAYNYSSNKNCYVTQIRIPREAETIEYELVWRENGNEKNMFYGSFLAKRAYTITEEQKNIGHILLYDFVNDKGAVDVGQLIESMLKQMHRVLPPLYGDKEGWNPESTNDDQLSIAEELYYWVQQILKGWTLPAEDGRVLAFSEKSQALDRTLILWLSKTCHHHEQDNRSIRHSIISVVIFLGLIRKNHTAHKETMALVCNALSLHDLELSEQLSLQEELIEEYDSLDGLPPISHIFHALFKRVKFNLASEWILLLPLYWLTESYSVPPNFPDTLKVTENLPELPRIEDCDWEEVKWKLSNDEAQQYYTQILPKIAAVSKVHPWIVRPYLYILRGKTVLLMLGSDTDRIAFLDPGLVIIKLIDAAKVVRSGMDLEDIRRVGHYVEEYLETMASSIKNSSAGKKCFSTLIQILKSFYDYLTKREERNWTNIIWCMDCGYKPVNCALEKGLKCGAEEMLKVLLYACRKSQQSSKDVEQKHHRITYSDWNHMASYKWAGSVLLPWVAKVEEMFREKLDRNCNGYEMEFLDEYVKIPEMTEPLQKHLDEKCHKCVLHVLNKPWYAKMMKSDQYKPLAKIFEAIFSAELCKTSLQSTTSDEKALRFILGWSSSIVFYQKCYRKKFAKSTPSITSVTKMFLSVIESLKSGAITVKFLEIVMSHAEKVVHILAAIKQEDGSPVDYEKHIRDLLERRKIELKCIKEVCEVFEGFKVMCDYLVEVNVPVDFHQVECLFRDKSLVKLSELTKLIQTLDEDGKEVTKKDLSDLKTLTKLKGNNVFMHLWIKTALKWDIRQKWKEQNIDCDWKIALHKLWATAKHELVAYKKILLERNIYLMRVETWFGCYEKHQTEKMVTEVLEYPDSDMDEQVFEKIEMEKKKMLDQLQFFMRMNMCKEALTFSLRVKTLFSLTEDFGVFETMQAMVKKRGGIKNPFLKLLKKRCRGRIRRVIQKSPKRPALQKMTQQVMQKTVKKDGWRLCDITPDVIHHGCIHYLESISTINRELKVFLEQEKFINWLQQKIHDRDEINSMCDLALTYNSDMILENVNAFSNAVNGFAPLIFDIVGKNIGIQDLANRCTEVQSNIREKPSLKEDWKKSAENLPLFEEIELRHGSVEKSFLKTVHKINNKGVFRIQRASVEDLSLEKIVLVSFPEDEEKGDLKPVQFKELHEIHSVLMLITSTDEQSRKSIAHFSSLYTTAERLGRALIALIETGCMLFCNFSVIISPIIEPSNEAVLNVSFGNDTSPLGGTCALDNISELAKVLEETQTKWAEYVLNKREEHYYLNEYSILQITYLCRELATFRYTHTLLDQVHALISVVSPGPWPDLDDLLEDVTSTVQATTSDDFNEEEQQQAMPENKEQAVRLLISEGIEEDVAKAAVQGSGDDDPFNWVLIHQHDDEFIAELREQFDTDMAFSSDGPKHQITASFTQNNLRCDLEELVSLLRTISDADDKSHTLFSLVKTISDNFIAKTSVLTLRNYLSVEHLGQFLTRLKSSSISGLPFCRPLIQPLQKAKPNLVICNDEEVLATATALYMHNPRLPLPTKSEVLVCSEVTVADEVKRFMRRALTKGESKGKPLFCLPFCDKLSFNVMKATEDIFNTLRDQRNMDEDYQLVLICSDQKSYIASCFEKNQVNLILDTSCEKISAYIGKYLVATDKAKESAAHVDKQKRMVSVVASGTSGNGKSLYIRRQQQKLKALQQLPRVTTIRLLERSLKPDAVISKLLADSQALSYQDPNFIWLDLTPAVETGHEQFIFNLLILGHIEGSGGKIWRRHENHFYIIEITDCELVKNEQFSMRMLGFLPHVIAVQPNQVLDTKYAEPPYIGMDEQEFLSPVFQRPYQYLRQLAKGTLYDSFTYSAPAGDAKDCVKVLLESCGSSNISWSQVKNFASFLNFQLENCEKSDFLNPAAVGFDLKGFKQFAVKFMVRMSQDFGTPTAVISDESSPPRPEQVVSDQFEFPGSQSGVESLHPYVNGTPMVVISDENSPHHDQMTTDKFEFSGRRRWEESLHPYVFFNQDRMTVTFINVNLSDGGDLLDYNDKILQKGIAHPWLVACLKEQMRFDRPESQAFQIKFDKYTRAEKLGELCKVIGIKEVFDPDETYELTADCVQKIIAIHMRFQCKIPVIIMGETGCGKTRMVEFMSKLLAGKPSSGKSVKNLIVRKIYSGIKITDIFKSIQEAEQLAMKNEEEYGLNTILFYDEANTTDAIHAIKEVMCDQTADGRPLEEIPLQIIAACNPYKKLSEHAIKRLEKSGLGSKIHASAADQKVGDRMRSLLYKVNPLPPSMRAFTWDFGQLDTHTEALYIKQMAKRLKRKAQVNPENFCLIVTHAQSYMRKQKDECRFVSLRDVERCMDVFEWFINHHETLFPLIEEEKASRYLRTGKCVPDLNTEERAILQTLGVCYHASLEDRQSFREDMCRSFRKARINSTLTEADVLEEFIALETAFLKGVRLGENISCNKALLENFFMMAICADLKIPLFLIGKPGSSKSLSKSLISNNMQGKLSRTKLFQTLKQIRLISYQCSALSDADGIKRIFEQCVELQEKEDINCYTSVAVLDEIGLAEDSPNMPLKILHPLLESGSTESESITDYNKKKKVGFIGISNWPLDPAKLNRGIFVLRTEPNKEDLLDVAKSICQGGDHDYVCDKLLPALIEAYLEIYHRQKVEYYGLRDYYSLIKMVFKSSRCSSDTALAVLRNFSGAKTSDESDTIRVFQQKLAPIYPYIFQSDVPLKEIVTRNLLETDTRFLLLLTNHYPSLNFASLLMEELEENVEVVFGSSFPDDHSYTEICRNINRIKVCMEMGEVVVLLNMADVHESLYDALNQHFVTLGGKRYVDLGLGEHRVKCCVSPEFRLIVIEQKDTAYNEYPIPLLNRLEKHHLDAKTLLQEDSHVKVEELKEWVESFTTASFQPRDAFVGYHEDTVSSLLLFQSGNVKNCKKTLLDSMTMDAAFRQLAYLPEEDFKPMWETYFQNQNHDTMMNLLKNLIAVGKPKPVTMLEIVSYSRILSIDDRVKYEKELCLSENSMMVMNLEQFHTRKECEDKLDVFIKRCKSGGPCHSDARLALLLVQCSQAQKHGDLIECFKHIWTNKLHALETAFLKRSIIMVIVWSVERFEKAAVDYSGKFTSSFVLQQSKDYKITYVDELLPPDMHEIRTSQLLEGKISKIGSPDVREQRKYMIHLIKSCICEAVRKVKIYQNGWYFRCFKILMDLCNNQDMVSSRFQNILLDKLNCGLAKLDENGGSTAETLVCWHKESWITKEAHNRENLQEGGTFRKTLLLRLKQHTSQLLAYLISIIDVHSNLDIISSDDQEAWKIEMWLRLFQDMHINWHENILDTQEFFIGTSDFSDVSNVCTLPFSSAITSFLQEEWHRIKEQGTLGKIGSKKETLIKSFRNSKYYMAATGAKDEKNVMSTYASDLIMNYYLPVKAENDEAHAVNKIVLELAKHECGKMAPSFHQGDVIALVFLTYKKLSKSLKKLSNILEACPQLIDDAKVEGWIEKQKQSANGNIHVSALIDAFDILRHNAKTKDYHGCLEWMDAFSSIKHIFHPILDQIEDQDQRNAVLKNWVPLSLLDLMLLQLIPHDKDKKLQYAEIIWVQAKLMLRGSEGAHADLQSSSFLMIVCNVLKKCYEDICLKFMVSWKSTKCKHCKKPMKVPQLLDCGHFICQPCRNTFVTAQSPVCPFCRNAVSNNPKMLTMSEDESHRLANFKSSCTGFFMEYLKNICFSRDLHCIAEEKIRQLFKMLLPLVAGTPPAGKPQLRTEAIDLDINTRSSILSVLFNVNHEFTKDQLNNFLGRLDNRNADCLIEAIINFFEQRILLAHSCLDIQAEEDIKRNKALLENAWERVTILKGNRPDVQMLQSIAEVRYSLRRLSSFMCTEDEYAKASITLKAHYATACGICGEYKANVLRQFLVKSGCEKFGMEWYNCWKEHKEMEDMIPLELKRRTTDLMGDCWSLMGEEYMRTKSLLLSYSDDDAENAVNELISSNATVDRPYEVLALLKWAQCSTTGGEAILHKQSDANMESIVSLDQELSSSLSLARGISETDANTVKQLVLVVALSIYKGQHLMDGFSVLAMKPTATSAISPSSMFTEGIACANSDWATMVIQFILNASVLIASIKDREAVAKMLGIGAEPGVVEGTLSAEILMNIQEQSRILSVSKNEVLIILYLIMHRILNDKKSESPKEAEALFDWTAEGGRRKWKKQFHDYYLKPIYDNMDDEMFAARAKIEKDMSAVGNPLYRLVKEINPEVMPTEILSWKHVMLWRYTKECTLSDFLHCLQQQEVFDAQKSDGNSCETPEPAQNAPDSEVNTNEVAREANVPSTMMQQNTGQGGVLRIIFGTNNLDLVKYLEPALKFQKLLILKCQNSLPLSEADRKPLHKFVENDEEKDLAKEYVELWNKIHCQDDFQDLGKELGIPAKFFHPATMDTPVSLGLPSKRGLGRCGKLLVSYLIDIQNSFLSKCAEVGKFPENTKDLEVTRLSRSHFIRIDKKQDLIPLVYTYTKYEISTGSEGRKHYISYNLEALEKQVEEKFVNYKQKIDIKTIPCIRYPEDVETESEWRQMIAKTPQRKLPEIMAQQVDGSASHSTLIYTGVRALTQAITYIAKGDVKPETKLLHFLKTRLFLPEADLHAIPSTANVEHTLALYLRLSWHRSIIFMSRGLDPYKEALSYVVQEKILDKKLMQELRHVFRAVDIPVFQQQMNELIMRVPDFPPDSSLVEEVLPDYEFITDGNNQDWSSKIPLYVCLKHVSHLIQLSLEFQQSQGMGEDSSGEKSQINTPTSNIANVHPVD